MWSDLARDILGGLAHLVLAHPRWALTVWGACWLTGAAKKGLRATGYTLVGLLVIVGLAGLAWKRRKDIGTGVLVVGCVVPAIAWSYGLWRYPHMRFQLLLPLAFVTLLAAFVPGGWVDATLGDRTLAQAVHDYISANEARVAVTATARRRDPSAKVGKPVRAGRGWTVPTHTRGDPERLIDAAEVGARVNGTRQTARSVRVTPRPELGRADVHVSDEAPPPVLTPWQRLKEVGVRPWPGPYTDHPDGLMRLGFDADGAPLTCDIPGIAGGNILIAGATGSGKSTCEHVCVQEMCFRQGIALILLDPDGVELGPYRDRATIYAGTSRECVQVIRHLEPLLERRIARVDGTGDRYWSVRRHGPRVVVVVDEYAAIPADAKGGMEQWLARARKGGGGSIIATQRPERGVIPLIQRDNCRVRLALGMESDEASRMVLGVPDATEIPLGLKGAMLMRVEREIVPGRCYLPVPTFDIGPDADPILESAHAVARATRSLAYTVKEIS